jgi:hypothetical protein
MKIVHSLALLSFCALPFQCVAADCQPVRRALIVGISKYVPGPARKAPVRTEKPAVSRIAVSGNTLRPPSTFVDLPAAVNDANSFADLLGGYEFQTANVTVLRNEQATAQEILDHFQKNLIDESSCPGDVSVFYYSGHGSQIRNLAKVKANDPDPYDRTLVPYDVVEGVPDVRSRELVRLYKKAVDKGIYLTVILDSCQSAGLSRGAPDFALSRAIGEDPRVVDDPGLLDSQGKPLDLARKRNTGKYPTVLFLFAATEKEAAKESGGHGYFTSALLEKLPNHADRAAISDVFSDVKARVASVNNQQHPQIDGEERQNRDLFGDPADALSGMIAHSTTGLRGDSTIVLDKGRAAGLYEGCELVGASPSLANVRLTIRSASGATSVAELTTGSGVPIPSSSRFRLERWVVPEKNPMHFYFEQAGPAADELQQAAQVVAKLEAAGVKIIADPVAEAANVQQTQVWWMGGGWRLLQSGSGKSVELGKTLDADAVRKALQPGAHLFVNFPLPADAAKKVGLGDGTLNDAVQIQKPDDPNFSPAYILAGRWNAVRKDFEYAWIRPGVTEEDQGGISLPVRTDWLPANGKELELELRAKALQLNRINGWVSLNGPPGSGDAAQVFPYRLELRKAGTNEVLKPGESHTTEGEEFKAWLRADPKDLDAVTSNGRVPSRWVYVLALDRDGSIDVIVPAGDLNVGNRVPEEKKAPPTEIALTSQEWDFKVGEPFGLDTYILLSSDEEIDPRILPAKGVRTRSVSRGGSNPLADLLSNIGVSGQSRGSIKNQAVPTSWSVQTQTFRSIAKN